MISRIHRKILGKRIKFLFGCHFRLRALVAPWLAVFVGIGLVNLLAQLPQTTRQPRSQAITLRRGRNPRFERYFGRKNERKAQKIDE